MYVAVMNNHIIKINIEYLKFSQCTKNKVKVISQTKGHIMNTTNYLGEITLAVP